MLVRIKEFELEGEINGLSWAVKIKLGALTVGQIEELGIDKPIENATTEKALFRMYSVVSAGLNNAVTDSEPPWNPERVPKEMDQALIDALWRTVIEWSGYELPKSAGEARAAS